MQPTSALFPAWKIQALVSWTLMTGGQVAWYKDWHTTSHICSDKSLTCWTHFPCLATCIKLLTTQHTFYLQFWDRFKAKKKRKNINSNAYRQWFCNSYLDRAKLGPLQGLDSILQAGVLQVGAVNIHESVSWQQSAVLLSHTAGNQWANHDHCLGGIQWVLWWSRSSKVQWEEVNR